ncbi:MAG: arsenic resistance protein [Bacteriovoracia bacterium]
MTSIERFQIILILLSAALGLFLSQFSWFSQNGGKFVIPFLILMLTIVFLNTPLRDMSKAFKNLRFSGLSLVINFLWTPLLAWLIGTVFLKGEPDLWMGFLMLLVTPCTDWYLVFTQMAGGQVALATTLLPWHLILQLVLLPFYLFIFAEKLVPIHINVLLLSVFFALLIPLTIKFVLEMFFKFNKKEEWFKNVLIPKIAPFQLIFLFLAIAAMFSSQGKAILSNPEATFKLIPPLLLFYGFNLILGLNVCKLSGIDNKSSIGFCFSILARNSPIALAIAATAFPERPVIALALIIGPLIELPALAAIANFFRRRD